MVRNVFHRLCVVVLAVGIAGCRSASSLNGGPVTSSTATSLATLTVARLNPASADEPADPQRPNLHGVEVLASKTVTDPATAARIRRCLATPDTYDGPAHRPCFLPRLVVRDGDGEHATDYVICVQCGRIDVYRPETLVESHTLGADASDFFEQLAAEMFPQIRSTATAPAR